MAQVSTQAELTAAIAASDPNIQIAADFYIDTQQTIRYSVLIASAEGGSYTLTRANSYNGPLFQVQGGGSLTLQNITLDGAAVNLTSNTATREGVVTAELDQTTLLDNTALSGGGFYSAEGTGRITIRGGSEIKENNAASGGGIYHAGQRILALEGVTITGNTAATGQGVYNAGPLELGPLAAIPDRLYLPDQDAVPTITEHLASGSVVQLERSGYVTPTQDGTPIVVARSELELVGEDAVVFRTPPTGFVGWRFRVSDDRRQVLLTPAEYHLFYENTLGADNPNPNRYTEFTPTITLLPLANTPGNLFLGWYDAAEGGSQVTQISTGNTGDKTLYARWQVVEYTVTYYGNDAGGPTAENVPPSQRVQGGESAVLSDQRPTRTGYEFVGWNTDPSGSGTGYPSGGTVPNVLADVSLYAQWQYVDYTLTYHGNDEGGPPAQNIPSQQYFHVELVFQLSDTVPTREGYRFTAWNTLPDGGGTAYQPGASFGPTIGDADLYAQWAALPPVMHMLAYHGNDAGGPPAQSIPGPTVALDGQDVTLSSAIPTREGFAFSGWNTHPAGVGTAYQPGDTVPDVRADINLYAQWIPLPPACHTLTYCGNDAGGPPARRIPNDQCVPAGQCVRVSCRPPCRTCYYFAGWSTDPCGAGRIILPGQVVGPVMWDICLYAQWRRLPPPRPGHICRSRPDRIH